MSQELDFTEVVDKARSDDDVAMIQGDDLLDILTDMIAKLHNEGYDMKSDTFKFFMSPSTFDEIKGEFVYNGPMEHPDPSGFKGHRIVEVDDMGYGQILLINPDIVTMGHRILDPNQVVYADTIDVGLEEGREVVLAKEIPKPEDWVRSDNFYTYEHVDTGRTIHEESYEGKVKKREVLATYIDEVPEYHE